MNKIFALAFTIVFTHSFEAAASKFVLSSPKEAPSSQPAKQDPSPKNLPNSSAVKSSTKPAALLKTIKPLASQKTAAKNSSQKTVKKVEPKKVEPKEVTPKTLEQVVQEAVDKTVPIAVEKAVTEAVNKAVPLAIEKEQRERDEKEFKSSSLKKPKDVKKSYSAGKTEGSYLGFNLIGVDASFHERYSTDFTDGVMNDSQISYSNHGIGGGLSYKYAFNFNKFFIAPGVFFDQLNTVVTGADGQNSSYSYANDYKSFLRINLKNRYGIKTDIGYDITDKISPYFSSGYSVVNYSTQNVVNEENVPIISTVRSASTGSLFYGAGLKVNYNKDLAFNIEYISQKFLAKTTLRSNPYHIKSFYAVDLETVSVGVTHRF